MFHRRLVLVPLLSVLASCSAGGGGNQLAVGTLVPADGVTISQIAIYQGPKLVLTGGTETGKVTVPVIAGRDALVRVFVQTDATYDGSPVTAHLFLGKDSTTPLEVVGTPSAPSTDDALDSTLNFDVPGASLVAGLEYKVELLQPFPHAKGTSTTASYPAAGYDPLPVSSDGMQLKVVIVPIKYATDKSNRLPDTSATQIQNYKDAFMAAYPIAGLDLSVRAPWTYSGAVGADGTGWPEVLMALADYRQQQGAPPDEYWFGTLEPAASFGQYCGAGCVAGLGLIGMAGDTYARAAVGLGYMQASAYTTAIHEVGHTQGRMHAPCGGASNVDPMFPYAMGDIGDWGYDIVHQKLYQPGKASDMMGYCDPVWISDYTFNAIFERIKLVNGAEFVFPEADLDRTWERARVDGAGKLTLLPPIAMHTPPVGQPTAVTLRSDRGTDVVTGQYMPFDHVAGGLLFWPAGASPTVSAEARLDAARITR